MKPYLFAKKECALCDPHGLCIGPRGGYCQLKRYKACALFEEAVLPIADKDTKDAYEYMVNSSTNPHDPARRAVRPRRTRGGKA